ncbi:MAG: hypothetical protein ACKOEO_03900 [Planctomycetaceae bacterium]
MSRFCSPALAAATVLAGITGCMNPYYNQPYPGQQGYGMPGMMAQPGVITVPPSSSTPQPLGNGGSTFQPDTAPKDDFDKDGGDAPFFQRNQDGGGVPPARDPGAAGSGTDSGTFPVDNN